MVVQPRVSYPTYEIGTQLAGATVLKVDDVSDVESWRSVPNVKAVWVNSPCNPTGETLSREWLYEIVAAARQIGAVVLSDECYAMLDWRTGQGGVAPCALDPQVCEGSADGVLVLYSLSKQSNMAGYRTAFIAGDYALVARMTAYRKQIGQIIPGPVQAAMAEGLRDGDAVREQKARYERRLSALVGALRAYGYDAAMPQGALYVWGEGPFRRLLAGHGRSGAAGHCAEPRGVLRRPGVSAVLRHRHRLVRSPTPADGWAPDVGACLRSGLSV